MASFWFFKDITRINRVQYIARSLLCVTIIITLSVFGLVDITLIGWTASKPLLTLSIISVVLSIPYLFILTIRRLHDMNFSGWWSLLFNPFIPISHLFLFLLPGNKKENEFGDVPIKATKVEYFVTILLFPTYLLLSFLFSLKS